MLFGKTKKVLVKQKRNTRFNIAKNIEKGFAFLKSLNGVDHSSRDYWVLQLLFRFINDKRDIILKVAIIESYPSYR